MNLGDLIFVLSFLGTIVAAGRIVWRMAHRRTAEAKQTSIWLAAFLAVYFAILVVVSLVTPQRMIPMGEPQCFDEWCIAVKGVEKSSAIAGVRAKGVFWVVTTQVSNRGGGRRQRETGALAYLTDRDGRRFDPSPEGQSALQREGAAGSPLTAFVDPGSSFHSRIVFDVPASARGLAFVKATGWFPVALIIGDPGSLLHRRTIVRLS